MRYAGQHQTCARCHETPQHFMGKGVARNCQAAGGPKVEMCDYILKLWERIGYNPGDFDRGDLSGGDEDDLEAEPAVQQQTGGSFTPPKTTTDPASFSGVRIKSFPEDTQHDDIRNFLIASGLAEQKQESVQIKPNGTVTIMNLTSEECLTLIGVIHHKTHFGIRMFCNGIIPLTPEKPGADDPTAQATRCPPGAADQTMSPTPSAAAQSTGPPFGAAAQATSPPPSAANLTVVPTLNPALPPTTSIQSTMVSPCTSLNQSQLDFGAASVITELDSNLLGNEDLLRRYSLSMRDAPCGSIAGDILHPPNLQHRQSKLLNDIRDMSKKMSDFESAQESLTSSTSDSSSSSDSSDHQQPFQTMNSRKRGYRNKRRNSQTPNKETFMKKSNLSSSSPSLIYSNHVPVPVSPFSQL